MWQKQARLGRNGSRMSLGDLLAFLPSKEQVLPETPPDQLLQQMAAGHLVQLSVARMAGS